MGKRNCLSSALIVGLLWVGVPWRAEAGQSLCPADLDPNGVVNASDLFELLFAWGPNPDHPADFDGDRVVNASDLAELLGEWGMCPPGCGNNFVEPGEECDPPNGVTCNTCCEIISATSDCCFEHAGDGCQNNPCENDVCGEDPFCCTTQWDFSCAVLAGQLCLNLCDVLCFPACGVGAGDCCTANGGTGCNDTECCVEVCLLDQWCCEDAWDSICASEAAMLCFGCN